MNQFTFDSSWNQIKGKLREKYGQLTDDDLEFAQGKGEELLGRLQYRLGLGADQLNTMLNDMKRELNKSDGEGTMQGTFESAKQRVSEVAGNVKSRMTEVAGEFRSSAVEQAEHLRQRAGEVYDDARQRVRTWRDEGEEYVREQPRTAVLTALAAGFVLGLIIKR